MLEYYRSHIYLLFILIVLAALAVFACSKAFKAASARNKEANAVMKKLEEDTALRKEFENVTPEKARSSDPEKLFRGVALGCCRSIEKADDMTAEFESFTLPQKCIYSLYFVFEDGSETLSNFFKMNGKPLTVFAKQAVDGIYNDEIKAVFGREYIAYDEDDETTSLIKSEIEKDDKAFAALMQSSDMYAPIAEYIIENIADFS